MTIPESQLNTWANQGAVSTAKATHQSIRNSLTADASPIHFKNFEIYLQGSYKNSTNIRGDSDVDLVVQLNSTFQGNTTQLREDEKRLYEATYEDATYLWLNFRADVLQALRTYYGPRIVSEGNKSIKVVGGPNRLPADVVPCLQYRRYIRFRGKTDQRYVEGIVFYTIRENRRVINYPKVHYDNGVSKNSNSKTAGRYKPTVRVFKNARTHLVKDGTLSPKTAPSYFLECLIYNVPDSRFAVTHQQTFYNVLEWLGQADLSQMLCQNEQLRLFGSLPEQWSISDAQNLISDLIDLWNNW